MRIPARLRGILLSFASKRPGLLYLKSSLGDPKNMPTASDPTAEERARAGGAIVLGLEQSQRPWDPLKRLPGAGIHVEASAPCEFLVGWGRKLARSSLLD